MTDRDDRDLGYTDILAGLSARFGTRFGLEAVSEHTSMVAKFEGGIKVMVSDCGGTLSSVEAHLDGRATGYYVEFTPPQVSTTPPSTGWVRWATPWMLRLHLLRRRSASWSTRRWPMRDF